MAEWPFLAVKKGVFGVLKFFEKKRFFACIGGAVLVYCCLIFRGKEDSYTKGVRENSTVVFFAFIFRGWENSSKIAGN